MLAVGKVPVGGREVAVAVVSASFSGSAYLRGWALFSFEDFYLGIGAVQVGAKNEQVQRRQATRNQSIASSLCSTMRSS